MEISLWEVVSLDEVMRVGPHDGISALPTNCCQSWSFSPHMRNVKSQGALARDRIDQHLSLGC